jgi:hypothetical protein
MLRGRCGARRDLVERPLRRRKRDIGVAIWWRLFSAVERLDLARGIPPQCLKERYCFLHWPTEVMRRILAPCRICTQPQRWVAGVWSYASRTFHDVCERHAEETSYCIRDLGSSYGSTQWRIMNVSSSGLHHGNTCACSPDPSQTLKSGLSFPHLAHLQLQMQIPTVLANGLEVLLIGSIRVRLILGKEVNSGNARQTRDRGEIA